MAEKVLLTEAFDKVYKDLDEHAAHIVKVMSTTCVKGCAHCCYLLTLVVPSEGRNIALNLMDEQWWPKLIPLIRQLGRVARESDYVGVSRRTYFRKQLRCPFLSEANECGIYKFRPSPCRYHYVRSAPEHCSPNAPENSTTEILGMIPLEEHVWNMDEKIRKVKDLASAPISSIVLWAFKEIFDDMDQPLWAEMFGPVDKYCIELKEVITQESVGLKTPWEWIQKHWRTIDDSPVFQVEVSK